MDHKAGAISLVKHTAIKIDLQEYQGWGLSGKEDSLIRSRNKKRISDVPSPQGRIRKRNDGGNGHIVYARSRSQSRIGSGREVVAHKYQEPAMVTIGHAPKVGRKWARY